MYATFLAAQCLDLLDLPAPIPTVFRAEGILSLCVVPLISRSRVMGSGRAMDRTASPWVADLSDACRPGSGRREPQDAARRFADLRANLKG